MADAEFGYIEPPESGSGAANSYMDAETTGRSVAGVPVHRQRVTSRLLDHNGVPFTQENRLFVDVGANLTVSASFQSAVSVLNDPPVLLGPGETFTGQWEDLRDFAAIVGVASSDQPFRVFADFADTLNADPATTVPLFTTSQDIPANFAGRFIFNTSGGRFFRARMTNLGTVAQTSLRAEIRFAFNPPAVPQLINGAQTSDLTLSSLTQSHLKARIFSGASAGAWAPLGTNGAGSLMVTGPLTDAQLRAARLEVNTDDGLFKRLLKFEPAVGFELRAADSVTDRYHGSAPDGTATTAASWAVVRFYKDATGLVDRVRYRTGVVWDDRAVGWT